MPLLDLKTLGPARLDFADERDLDAFVDKLGRFERGDLPPDEWKQFRLVNGVYGQRQDGEMMVRVKIPQGILAAHQLRAIAEVSGRFSNGVAHVTTRQNIQLHFVKLEHTDAALRVLLDAGLTTREACGNSVRNVTACPYAGASALEPFDSSPYAESVTRYLLRGPLSSSLPRKFKIAFSGCCGHDCAGGSFNDIGFLAREAGGRHGFRVTLGGGLSTLRRAGILAHEFAPAEEVLEIAEAVVRVFNRTGDRKNRLRARLKYVIEKLGADDFLKEYYREREAIHRPIGELPATADRIARLPRARAPRDGLEEFARTNVRAQRGPEHVAVAVRLPSGALTVAQLRGLADLASEFSEEGEVRTTLEQNLLFRFVRRSHLSSLHSALIDLGLAESGARTVSDVVSCPGASSCRLAVTSSRAMASELSESLKATPERAARAESLSIKISGCPNGCGQHYVAGIGLQGSVRKVGGRAVPQYFVYLGGGFGVTRASFGRLAAKIPARRVPEAIERLIELYDREKAPGESPEAYLARAEPERIKELLRDLEALDDKSAAPADYVDLGERDSFTVTTMEGECAS